ncbi:NAD(P)-dependent oxidoreductase [Orrella sp. NBD-18]|uniref:NAD(P)-dependent oxidoreductase n=1 Tax=Sheuella amnicola TaxID=2707330 RepID=A0A6B2QUP9_9BURK|nr:NAD(P)-dependent oxidoreductase [Sheuella amnicola]NDY82080.1 NAD(P)-dependent oxidoreductase [Sheuella amnicola]
MTLKQAQAGFIGLGAMGGGIARRLANAGVKLHVYDPDPSKTAAFAKWDAIVHRDPQGVADAVEVVFACLPNSDVSKTVAFGDHGVIHGKMIKTYIEMSTIGRTPLIEIAKTLAAKNIQVLDCPVSGGPKGADSGTLAIMVAGDPVVIDSIRDLLNLISKNVFDIGPEPGMAQMMKLVNNLISATNMASAFEALVLGAKAGLDADMMVNVINASTGRNSATTDKIPKSVLPGTFDYGAATKTLHKDITLGLIEAEELQVPMWVARNTRQMWEFAMTQGEGDLDFTSLIKVFERWVGVEVRSKKGNQP